MLSSRWRTVLFILKVFISIELSKIKSLCSKLASKNFSLRLNCSIVLKSQHDKQMFTFKVCMFVWKISSKVRCCSLSFVQNVLVFFFVLLKNNYFIARMFLSIFLKMPVFFLIFRIKTRDLFINRLWTRFLFYFQIVQYDATQSVCKMSIVRRYSSVRLLWRFFVNL